MKNVYIDSGGKQNIGEGILFCIKTNQATKIKTSLITNIAAEELPDFVFFGANLKPKV